MEFAHLRYFIILARELHFARAAEQLGITQPPLSRAIQKLEKELNVRLFDRSNKWKVSLTAAGAALLPEAENLLIRLKNTENIVRSAALGESGRLTVGAISSMIGNTAFIDTLAQMQRQYPAAVVEIIDSTSGELIEKLKERSVDLAMMRLPDDFTDPELNWRKLYDDRISVVLPKGHRLAGKKELKVSDLKHEPFVLVPEKASAVLRNYIRDFCLLKGGFMPKISKEISNSYTALRLTGAGAGITMVSSVYDGIFADRLVYRSFSDFKAQLTMYAVYPDGPLFPLAEKFLDILRCNLKMKSSLSKNSR